MRREISSELLDMDLGTPREVAESLDDLWRMNRWLGGVSSSLRLLDCFLARTGRRSIDVLEVGAGDARLGARLQQVLLQRGVRAKFVVVDRSLRHLQNGSALSRGLQPVAADALRLPFPEDKFDLATCNLFFHHFSGEQAVALLRSLMAVSKLAVLVNDLERHFVPYLFIRIARMFTRSRLTRHDAPASVRQAYTREELVDLTAAAGFADFEVRRLLPFRLGLTLWKTPA